MDTRRIVTTGGTVLAAVSTVGLMLWQEADASRRIETGPTPEPQSVAAVDPVDEPPVAAPVAEQPDLALADLPADPAPVVLASAEAAPVEDPSGLEMPDTPVELIVDDIVTPPAAAPVEIAAVTFTAGEVPAMPGAPDEAMTSVALATPGAAMQERMASLTVPLAAEPAAPAARTDETLQERNAYGIPCDLFLTSSPEASGMVALTLSAPCHESVPITVSHGDMTYTDTTSSIGTYTAIVPALVSPAEFSIVLEDGKTAEASIDVPDLETVERVVLQWRGETGLQIHALEFGAGYGEPGHVWSGAPMSAQHGAAGRGGFLTVLGDGIGVSPQTVEIYTFPVGATDRDGVVRLSIEAEVTGANCGHDIEGQTLQRGADGGYEIVDLSLAMPDCNAQGEFLVLKNLFRDLRIAAR